MTTSENNELIVVAFDFTEQAETALSHANVIAKSNPHCLEGNIKLSGSCGSSAKQKRP